MYGIIDGIQRGIINSVVQQGALLKQFYDYVTRVLADAGLIRNKTTTQQYMQMAKSNGILDSIKFAWLGEAGYKQRTSGINTFWTKLYSLRGTNDAIQTTSTNQPYLSGNIAPNEKWCLKNPNGGDEYMTHPTISFAANEAWSVTTVVNNNGKLGVAGLYSSGVNTTLHCWYYGSFRIRFDNSLSSAYVFNKSLNNLIGKNTIITLSTKGDGTLSLYVNGVFIESEAAVTSIELSKIFFQTSYSFYGTIPIHIIRAQALTPSQVSAEANFLRTLYPEIPSVTIGSQVWATSNCEMVATPMGNLIANVTSNATWADSTNIYNTTYAATSGTDEQKTYAAVKAAAMWCYYNNDASLGAIYGKLYNWYAVKLLQMDIDYYNAANPSTPWGWRVPADTDFNTLATTLGGMSVAGGKMKMPGGSWWYEPNVGADNSSGFSSIGGGFRLSDGRFLDVYGLLMLGTISDVGDSTTRYFPIWNNAILYYQKNIPKSYGHSLRLIKS